VGWLTDSFEQYSVAWILIPAFVGGVIGSATRSCSRTSSGRDTGLRRDAKAVLARFTTPLLRSSEALERQINNFVRNADKDWYRTSDYYRLSTLYSFAEYLAWVRLIERRLGFIAIEHSDGGRRLDESNQRAVPGDVELPLLPLDGRRGRGGLDARKRERR